MKQPKPLGTPSGYDAYELRPSTTCAVFALAWFAAPTAARAAQGKAPTTVVCGSKIGERVSCAADTSGGVTLTKSLGTAACELGRTWGYDEKGVWVSDGCGAEFSIAAPRASTFGRYTPGVGFKVADTQYGDLNIRPITYLRYLNQLVSTRLHERVRQDDGRPAAAGHPAEQASVYFFGWIMGRSCATSLRLDVEHQPGADLAGGRGWKPQLQVRRPPDRGRRDQRLPGRSTEGTFPYWLSVDARHIADEYSARPYTTGIWANGQVLPRSTTR